MPIYLFWVAMATVFLVGLPFETIVLVTFVGLYIGRRLNYGGVSDVASARKAKKASIFATLATGAASLGISIFWL